VSIIYSCEVEIPSWNILVYKAQISVVTKVPLETQHGFDNIVDVIKNAKAEAQKIITTQISQRM
jgi:hypothetical protein